MGKKVWAHRLDRAPYKKYRGISLFVRASGSWCNGVNTIDDDSGGNKLDGGDNADKDADDRSWICV